LSQSQPRHQLGILLAFIGAVAASGKAIVVKLLLREGIDPITSLGLRMAFAAPVFAALAFWGARGNETPLRPYFGRIVVLGFTGYYLASTLDFLGLALISASLERLILYVYPTMVLLLVRLRGGPPIRARQWIAMLVSYAGVLMAFGVEAQHTMVVSESPREVVAGAALVLASGASYAVYLVFSGELVGKFGALRLTGLASAVACVFCIGQFVLLRPRLIAAGADWLTPRVIGLSVLNATVCTVMPMWMVMRGIQLIGAGLASQIGMIGPLATMFMAVVLLGEPLTPSMIGGTILVVAGIAWLSRAR
jgi:drug/metabolite transporter (DMT)-like permease